MSSRIAILGRISVSWSQVPEYSLAGFLTAACQAQGFTALAVVSDEQLAQCCESFAAQVK